MGQARVHGPGLVGAVEHFIKALVHHNRQSLAAVLRVATQRRPTTRHKLGKGLFEPFRCFDIMGIPVPMATLLIAAGVEGKQHLGRKLATFFEHCCDGVGVGFRMGWQFFQGLWHLKQFVQQKLHVAQWGGVAGHGVLGGVEGVKTNGGVKSGLF